MATVEKLRSSALFGSFLQRVVLPVGDLALGQRMMRRKRFLARAQWWDPARIRKERDALLRETVQIAYAEVPFYRRLWDEAGVGPDDIRQAKDLQKLPVVDKPMLRAAYPRDVTRTTGYRTFEVQTSGSSGEPFRLLEDSETAGWYRATLLLELDWAGWSVGERHVQSGMNPSRDLSRRLKDALLGCHYMSAARLTDTDLDEILAQMDRYQIRHVWGYPGTVYMLARRASQTGWNESLRSVITWGDTLHRPFRNMIENVFGTTVMDTYGCCEGMHIASQCEARDLYHIQSLDVVCEFVDDDGQYAPRDESANIVVTRLHAGAMPLIRYRIGDRAIQGYRSCQCGRGFETLEVLQGRDTDFITTPDGNRLFVNFFTTSLKGFPEIDSFQIVQEDAGSLTVRVVPTGQFDEETPGKILNWLNRGEAGSMSISVDVVSAIPLSAAGKRRFVINKSDRDSQASTQAPQG